MRRNFVLRCFRCGTLRSMRRWRVYDLYFVVANVLWLDDKLDGVGIIGSPIVQLVLGYRNDGLLVFIQRTVLCLWAHRDEVFRTLPVSSRAIRAISISTLVFKGI